MGRINGEGEITRRDRSDLDRGIGASAGAPRPTRLGRVSGGLVAAFGRGGFGGFPGVGGLLSRLRRPLIGVTLGGRLGYMLLYSPKEFFANPLIFFNFLDGGMASHGGIAGRSTWLFKTDDGQAAVELVALNTDGGSGVSLMLEYGDILILNSDVLWTRADAGGPETMTEIIRGADDTGAENV